MSTAKGSSVLVQSGSEWEDKVLAMMDANIVETTQKWKKNEKFQKELNVMNKTHNEVALITQFIAENTSMGKSLIDFINSFNQLKASADKDMISSKKANNFEEILEFAHEGARKTKLLRKAVERMGEKLTVYGDDMKDLCQQKKSVASSFESLPHIDQFTMAVCNELVGTMRATEIDDDDDEEEKAEVEVDPNSDSNSEGHPIRITIKKLANGFFHEERLWQDGLNSLIWRPDGVERDGMKVFYKDSHLVQETKDKKVTYSHQGYGRNYWFCLENDGKVWQKEMEVE